MTENTVNQFILLHQSAFFAFELLVLVFAYAFTRKKHGRKTIQ